jgi:hypothetical protein
MKKVMDMTVLEKNKSVGTRSQRNSDESQQIVAFTLILMVLIFLLSVLSVLLIADSYSSGQRRADFPAPVIPWD